MESSNEILQVQFLQMQKDITNLQTEVNTMRDKDNKRDTEIVELKKDVKNTYDIVIEIKNDMKQMKKDNQDFQKMITESMNNAFKEIDKKQLDNYTYYKRLGIGGVIGGVIAFIFAYLKMR